MGTSFNERKATQIAARFLNLADGKMREIRLVKFIYMADRTALERWGYPLTWDKFSRLPLGPVPSSVLNLANQKVKTYDGSNYWTEHIKLHKTTTRWGKKIPWCVLASPTGSDSLSKAALSLIDEVYAEFKNKDIVQVVDNLPEHEDPGGSSKPLPYSDLLRELGYSDAEDRAKELEEKAYIHEVLNC